MHPGVTYATTKFAVPFTVTVPADSPDRFWLSTSTSLARTLTIGHAESEGAGISFYLPTGASTRTEPPPPPQPTLSPGSSMTHS